MTYSFESHPPLFPCSFLTPTCTQMAARDGKTSTIPKAGSVTAASVAVLEKVLKNQKQDASIAGLEKALKSQKEDGSKTSVVPGNEPRIGTPIGKRAHASSSTSATAAAAASLVQLQSQTAVGKQGSMQGAKVDDFTHIKEIYARKDVKPFVHLARHNATGILVVLKRPKEKDDELSDEEFGESEFSLETRIMTSLIGVPNTAQLYGIIYRKLARSVHILEAFDSDLLNVLFNDDNRDVFTESQRKFVMRSILTGLEGAHTRKIIHRDLKPANVFISKDLSRCAVGDWGGARFMTRADSMYTPQMVTLFYRPPEILLEQPYSYSCDIWSAGVIMLELMFDGTMHHAGSTNSELTTLSYILNEFGASSVPLIDTFVIPEVKSWNLKFGFKAVPSLKGIIRGSIPKNIGTVELDLFNKMYLLDPHKRFTAKQALQHPWFKSAPVSSSAAAAAAAAASK